MLRTVAAAADMDQASLSKIELGQRFPTEEQTKMLAKFFGVDETEALARRMASKFQHDGERTPGAVLKAVQILAEEAGIYRTTKGTKNTKGGA